MSSVLERLIAGDEGAEESLFDNCTNVFWVDWKEPDDILAEYCESIIKSDRLSSDLDETGLYVQFDDKRLKVPLTYSHKDRHITLQTINDVMSGEYEIRFVWASDGGDTLAFAPLASRDWMALEKRFGLDAVDRAFMKLHDFPNVFTDPLWKLNPNKSDKPWWKFWS